MAEPRARNPDPALGHTPGLLWPFILSRRTAGSWEPLSSTVLPSGLPVCAGNLTPGCCCCSHPLLLALTFWGVWWSGVRCEGWSPAPSLPSVCFTKSEGSVWLYIWGALSAASVEVGSTPTYDRNLRCLDRSRTLCTFSWLHSFVEHGLSCVPVWMLVTTNMV